MNRRLLAAAALAAWALAGLGLAVGGCTNSTIGGLGGGDGADGSGGAASVSSTAALVLATCANGVLDPGETGTDCGPACGVPCGPGSPCDAAPDCLSGVCDRGECAEETCHDGIQNGSESDVDCGGLRCAPCVIGRACTFATDCATGVCVGGVCGFISCSDGIANGDETDVDCGGSCPGCGFQAACFVPGDCKSHLCTAGACGPACDDDAMNGDETDVDCGGSCPRKCPPLAGCAVDADCAGGACDPATHVCTPTCSDGYTTPGAWGETDVDCGGPHCSALMPAKTCAPGGSCKLGRDCDSGVCKAVKCQPATCADGVKNQGEAGVDCGGPCPPC